jgi:hypothetical protein
VWAFALVRAFFLIKRREEKKEADVHKRKQKGLEIDLVSNLSECCGRDTAKRRD